jgi:glycine C-acetyltransferase/8-amino-7-oxononanoate synthase
MIEIEARLDELKALGLHRRTRLVSGPQGPHVLVDGKPVLLLCSDNYLGLADHPRVREAAADAAMRWGAGAGASRLESGTMTIHRRLEERLAELARREAALLFGSGYLARMGAITALARPGDVVLCDERNRPSIADCCRLSGAEVFLYDHRDVDHLAWGIAEAEGRAALIVTESLFSLDGDLAPLPEIVELAQRRRVRLLVDDAHGIGTLGQDGRGACVQAGVEREVDVIVGSLSKALGSYGAFVACDRPMATFLVNSARTFAGSTALPPAAVAGALAALDELEDRPNRLARLAANAAALRDGLAEQGFDVRGAEAQIVPLLVGDPKLVPTMCAAALERGVFAQALVPPAVPGAGARLRLTVMASHRADELRQAARTLAQVSRAVGFEPRALVAPAPFAAAELDDDEVIETPDPVGFDRPAPFDFEAPGPVRRAA